MIVFDLQICTVKIHSTDIVMYKYSQLSCHFRGERIKPYSQAKAKGVYQARVHSDQMVLVIVRWEAKDAQIRVGKQL
jgi:hypothetical protein